MLKIVILGTGNLAKHLYTAFLKADGIDMVQIVGRNWKKLQQFSKHSTITTDFDAIADADVYLISVKDDAIGEVSKYLSNKKGIVAHTSGAIDMNTLQSVKKAVFYPLQTFTKDKEVDFSNIPICIEADHEKSLNTLKGLAMSISKNVHQIDSEQRKKLHLAAVFVNNFTNYLYSIGEELCLEEGLSFDLLRPLIMETAHKVQTMSPQGAQTGPARRNDIKSMEGHLELLNKKEHITLYKLLSQAIKQAHEKEL